MLSALFIVILSLVIINIFIPVKYLSSYFGAKGEKPEKGVMRVTFLNVGYSDCTIVELPDGKVMLIDGGHMYQDGLAIFNYLNRNDIKKIDYLVCTSPKEEHCGRLDEVVKYKTIGKVFMPYVQDSTVTAEFERFSREVTNSKIPTEYCETGVGEVSDDGKYFFTFLSPTAHDEQGSEYGPLNSDPTDENIDAASAVLWLQYGENRLLFMGDVTTGQEQKIVDSYNENPFCYNFDGNAVNLPECNVIKVAHHGEKEARCAAFYDLVKPEMAIISTDTRANEMDMGVLSDISNWALSNVYITQISGNVTLKVKADSYVMA